MHITIDELFADDRLAAGTSRYDHAMRKPRCLSALVGILGLMMLAGCAASPAGTSPTRAPAASSSPTPTPTRTPTPYLATITLNADSGIAADQNGEQLATLDYYGRGADVAAKLSELFGFAPVVDIVEPIASDFKFSGTKYDWEGFHLSWLYGYESDPTSGTGTSPYSPSIFISTSVPSVRGVTIQGPNGVRVGDGQGDLSSLYPGQTESYPDESGVLIESASIGCIELPDIQDSLDSGIPSNCVGVRAYPSDGPVTTIGAPAQVNYGH
jgi:hypothetical protein